MEGLEMKITKVLLNEGEKMKTFIIKNNHMKMYYYNKCRDHGWITLWVGNGFICMGKKRGGE